MVALLPVGVLILLAGVMRPRFASWKESLLAGAIVWGVILTGMTELLSLSNGITKSNLTVSWAAVGAGSAALLFWQRRGRNALGSFAVRRRSTARFNLTSLVICVYVATLAVVALVAPPNTWDSMTYHMSRVMHWIQNESVAHYPTNIPRQLQLSPGAEFIILQLQLLSGGDRLANLPQWLAMLGSLLGTWLIAIRLGAGRRGRLLTVVFCLTIPMEMLQATSTQIDCVLAFWLVCATWVLLEIRDDPRDFNTLFGSALFGAAFGMALLTKSTAFLYGPPLLAWFGWVLVRRDGRRFWRPVVLAATLALSLNAGFFVRNYRLFGFPLGDPGLVRHVSNSSRGASVIASNLVRNLAVHANLPIPGIIRGATDLVRRTHQVTGIDPDDPSSTYPGTNFHIHGPFHLEDVAGCGVHLILILASIVLCMAAPPACRARLLAYAANWTAGFLIFCLYLKWQPWNARLHLPLFVLFSPLVGATLAMFLSRRVVGALVCGLLILAVPYLVFNHSRAIVQLRPLLGPKNLVAADRHTLLFINRPDLQRPYEELARSIGASGCERVGLVTGVDDWEYPLWVLLKDYASRLPRIEHVNVGNVSSTLAQQLSYEAFRPCRIVVWDAKGRPELVDPGAPGEARHIAPQGASR